MIDLRRPLAVLATRMPWASIEATLAPMFARQAREGRVLEGVDLFGATAVLAGAGASAVGRSRLPIRLMVGLLYLKHAYNESGESVCERWAQDVYLEFFCGVEELLAMTIAAATQMKAIKPAEFERVIVDSTVQEKAIAYPTDSRLLEVARIKLACLAQRAGLALKETYECEGKRLRRRAGGYAHAEQFKRLHRVLKRQRPVLGRVLRDIERKMPELPREQPEQVNRTSPSH